MKNLSIILAAFTAGTAPMLPQASLPAQEVALPAIPAERSGQEAVRSIRETYEKGGYRKFLEEMESSYQEVKEKGQLDQLAATRVGFSPSWEDWEALATKLQNEKSQELLDALKDQDQTPFVKKVSSAAANLSDDAHQKAISKIAEFRSMPPGTGENSDENLLIDLDLEYEYKSLHLDLPGASPLEKREKHCALKMEKLDKLVAASSRFEDPALKETVALYTENFDGRLAQSWDIADLNALASGQKKPANALEEKVASILKIYHEKFGELTREFLAENEKN